MKAAALLQEVCRVFNVTEERAVEAILKIMAKHGWAFGRVAEAILQRRLYGWNEACGRVRDLRTPRWQGMARNEW